MEMFIWGCIVFGSVIICGGGIGKLIEMVIEHFKNDKDNFKTDTEIFEMVARRELTVEEGVYEILRKYE